MGDARMGTISKAVALVLLSASPVLAADQAPTWKCPSLLGTWRAAYWVNGWAKLDKIDGPPLMKELIAEFRIEKDKAIATYGNGRKVRIPRTRDEKRPDIAFGAADGVLAAVMVEYPSNSQPSDKCYLHLMDDENDMYFEKIK
jgi:hypothetical protein